MTEPGNPDRFRNHFCSVTIDCVHLRENGCPLSAGIWVSLDRPRDEEEQKDELIRRLERKVGRMALEIDIMQEAMKPYRPFDGKTSSE